MNYPLISEYIEAIRSTDNFEKLSNIRPVFDDSGNPVMSSGNFAVVFKMADKETGKLYAVKCFTREQEEREERYKEIIKTLEEYHSQYIVSTQYFDKELFVDTTQSDETEFPVVAMDWVEGVSLDEYLRHIEGNTFKKELLANEFQKFIYWLLPKPFAHGDLKPDNIIIKEDGSIVLVDYDGMFVPSLHGKSALEIGTPPFQYKDRTLSDFDEYIDDYAAVLILLILKVNALSSSDFDACLTDNNAEFIRKFDLWLNEKSIAPLLSVYIMVSTFGRIDRKLLYCLLAGNSDFDFSPKTDLWFQKNVPQGDARAQYNLGVGYYKGDGVERDLKKAVLWFQKSAGQGFAVAQYGLGNCYRNGVGVEKDLAKAVEWYQKAADQGNTGAQCNLGVCYEYGNGVERNMEKAVEWYQKAAAQGNAVAQCNLGDCYQYGSGVEKDLEKAVKWYQKAAAQGNARAQCDLGLCYEYSVGVEKDMGKAVEWYQKAAAQGDAVAQCNLGNCYRYGSGVERNMEKAVEWYQKAAAQGNAVAQCNLGDCYQYGSGVEKDLEKAVKWYQKAAAQGNARAQCDLGLCYEYSVGVEKDMGKAVEWYQKAVAQGNIRAQDLLPFAMEKYDIERNLEKDVE